MWVRGLKIHGSHFRPAGREAVAGERAGHHHDDIFRSEGLCVEGNSLSRMYEASACPPMNFFSTGSSGKLLVPHRPSREIDPEDLAHVAAGEGGCAVCRE